MSEADIQPDVSALLQALREQAGQRNEGVHLYEADLIQRISQHAAELAGSTRPQPSLPTLLQVLRTQTEELADRVRFQDVGTVQHIGDGVATLSGLPRARSDELVDFPTDVQGLILNLNRERLDVILLGPDEGIQGGDLVTATGQRLRVPVGQALLGRLVNPLGEPLDAHGPIDMTEFHYLEREAPDIIERVPVNEPLHTGLKIIDALVPIGRGQRELIVGDRQTGKTTLAADAILNQRDSGVLCVYVAIGQKKSTTLAVVETLRREGALAHTIVVMSAPDDPPALRYLAPYAGCTMAEFLMHQGRDVLIVYDDLSKHADAYRELSLLLRRPPGREAYPGDIFYVHARLLERACKLAALTTPSPPLWGEEGEGSPSPYPGRGEGEEEEAGLPGGSLTALSIVEMQRGNIAAYIPTNLISINDGQIVLDTGLFNQGTKPAVDVGRSVSRVGGAAQTPAMRDVASTLRLELSQFEEVARFTRFGTEVDEATQRQIRRGQRLRAVLSQGAHQPLPLSAQVAILLAASEGYLDQVAVAGVPDFERGLLARLRAEHSSILHQLDHNGELSAENRETLLEAIAQFRVDWIGEP